MTEENPILEELKRLFNSAMLNSMIIPMAWRRGVLALFHIKEDKRNIYLMETMSVKLQNHQTRPIQVFRGVRQVDVISPKLFNNALEDVFKALSSEGMGFNVNGKYLTYLRFADDTVLMVESLKDVQRMLSSLQYCLKADWARDELR